VNGSINDHIALMRDLRPDFIYSLGWQQIYKKDLLSICSVIGIHESLLPEGAGAVPIANAMLHERPITGVTLFELDGGVDTGPIVGQLRGLLDPRVVTATELYQEAMQLERWLLEMFVPHLNRGTAPRIPQDSSKRTVYKKIDWSSWPEDVVKRTRTYPYA
jgi:methionyl-tRNA formyltransferase